MKIVFIRDSKHDHVKLIIKKTISHFDIEFTYRSDFNIFDQFVNVFSLVYIVLLYDIAFNQTNHFD